MVTVVTGADEMPIVSSLLKVKLYPNPSNGDFTVELIGTSGTGMIKADVLDIRGVRVHSADLKNEAKHTFSLRKLPAGLYFIRIIDGEKVATVKLLKTT
jgi:hypothetical protein